MENEDNRPSPAIEPRDSGLTPLDLAQLFGNQQPVVLEIGSGKGRFLIEAATADPTRNYVGIEKSLHYHRVIVDRIERRGLLNVRIINHDAFLVLRGMFAAQSISEIHIYFPDPWPRPRERKRRMIRTEVCEEMRRVMLPAAEGVYVTDHREYFQKAVPVLQATFDVTLPEMGATPPRTNYEAKYREQGREIFEARFRRRR